MATPGTYTIGKVVKKLQVTYPDLSVSKVRFLEAEGLLTPRRTKSGYRTYTDKDIERLEAVLRLQKSCFYPLSVIKEKLDAAEAGAAVPELSDEAAPAPEETLPATIALEDLPDVLGVSAAFARTLADAGFVELAQDERGKTIISRTDALIVRTASELKRYGIDPRLLRPYLQQANRELPIFKQVLNSAVGRQGSLEDPRTREAFDESLERLLALTSSIRDALLTRELRREFKYPDAL